MFSKKQYRMLLISSVTVFFTIALLIYMFYIRFGPQPIKKEPLILNNTVIEENHDEINEKQVVMSQDATRIRASTTVSFEILDQFGTIIQTEVYDGLNWIDYTRPQMARVFSDYVITKFDEDEVMLTRVIEKQVEPNYILTTYKGDIVISTERNGHKMFYKKTGLGQHDFSEKLGIVLDKGIPITLEQKDIILKNADELYIILQEYDE